MIDSSLLAPGEIDFNKINNTTIIMITPFDLFGNDRYIYTFEEICTEDGTINLNDGSKRIFINTHGNNINDVSPEFIALMKFIEYNEYREDDTDSLPNLLKIKARVSQVKASEKVGVKYMNRWEEEDIIRNEAKAEERISSVRSIMKNLKLTAEQAMEVLGIPKSEYNKYINML